MTRVPLFCLLAAAAWAQAPESEKKLAYEVATVKLNTGGDGRALIEGGAGLGGRFRVTNLPLRQLIILAYADRTQAPPGPGGGNLTITGAPGWVSTDRYDIDARPEEGFRPTQDQQQIMLRALLEERFGLKVRKETKDGPIYALVVDKGGVKAKKSEDQTPVTFGPPPGGGPGGPGGPPPGGPGAAVRGIGPGGPGGPGPGGAGPGGAGPGGPPPGNPFNGPMPRGIMAIGLGQMRASAQTMAGFANMLGGQAGRRVVDRTNLTGLYDFELKWTPDQLPNGANLPPGAQLPQIDPNGPSIFTALQEQLGLKLEPSTGPLESIVIESVSKPTEN